MHGFTLSKKRIAYVRKAPANQQF